MALIWWGCGCELVVIDPHEVPVRTKMIRCAEHEKSANEVKP